MAAADAFDGAVAGTGVCALGVWASAIGARSMPSTARLTVANLTFIDLSPWREAPPKNLSWFDGGRAKNPPATASALPQRPPTPSEAPPVHPGRARP